MVNSKKSVVRKKIPSKTRKSLTKIQRQEFSAPLEEEEFPIKLKQSKALRRLERGIVRQEKETETELDEQERDVSEDPREKEEGLGIEKDENLGIYPYPEIEQAEKKDADEDEEED
ncbi:MAG: hypothetical protein J4452_02770 [Candidatus Aenigmarchaeota archaeon]|nr:hypothetical protein [Candidatus Aenigmarchaeota archaeon]